MKHCPGGKEQILIHCGGSKIYPVHHVGTDRIYIAPGQESRLGRIYICPAKFLTGLGAGLGAGVGAGLVCGAG
jgi:hypothetical protein